MATISRSASVLSALHKVSQSYNIMLFLPLQIELGPTKTYPKYYTAELGFRPMQPFVAFCGDLRSGSRFTWHQTEQLSVKILVAHLFSSSASQTKRA